MSDPETFFFFPEALQLLFENPLPPVGDSIRKKRARGSVPTALQTFTLSLLEPKPRSSCSSSQLPLFSLPNLYLDSPAGLVVGSGRGGG